MFVKKHGVPHSPCDTGHRSHTERPEASPTEGPTPHDDAALVNLILTLAATSGDLGQRRSGMVP